MWIPRPSILWPLTLTRVLIFPSFSGTLYVTLICIRFPFYTELFQLSMPVVMPFPVPGMPHPFPFAPLFCLTHSYSFFDLSKLPDWTENSHNNICPPQGQKSGKYIHTAVQPSPSSIFIPIKQLPIFPNPYLYLLKCCISLKFQTS